MRNNNSHENFFSAGMTYPLMPPMSPKVILNQRQRKLVRKEQTLNLETTNKSVSNP